MVVMRRRMPTETPTPYPNPPMRSDANMPAVPSSPLLSGPNDADVLFELI